MNPVLDSLFLPVILAWMPAGGEWIVIAGIALLLFGNRLPGVARSLGRGINEFKRGLKDEPKDDADDEPKPPAKTDG